MGHNVLSKVRVQLQAMMACVDASAAAWVAQLVCWLLLGVLAIAAALVAQGVIRLSHRCGRW